MIRALFGIVLLSSCAPPKPAVVYEPLGTQTTEEEAGSATEPTDGSTATTEASTTTTEASTTTTTTTPSKPKAQPVPGTAAYCLYVGPEKSIVRCYWTSAECDEQITFNKDYGVDKAQVCTGVGEAHCFVADKAERCYPTADDCSENQAGFIKKKRQATDCAVKKKP